MLDKNPIITYGIISILCLLHLPYLLNCLYANPSADDLEYAASAIKHGFWNSYTRDYISWNGRYTDNFFAFASPLNVGFVTAYKLAAFFLLAIHYTSLWFFIKIILGKFISKTKQHMIALCISLLYLFNAPSLSESFYWYTGAISYQLPQSLSLFYFSLLYIYFTRRKKYLLFVLIPLIIFLIGFNEVMMVLLVVIHIFIFIRLVQLKNLHKTIFLFIIGIVLLSASAMIFSPGNAGRASHFTGDSSNIRSLLMSFAQVVRFSIEWTGQTPLIAASILFIPLSLKLNEHAVFKNKFHVHPLITLLALPAVIFLCVYPAYWGTGILGQHRTVNTAYFFFILIWFLNVHNLVCCLKECSATFAFWENKNWMVVLFFLFVGGICLTNNGYNAMSDLISGRSQKYNSEMNDRYAIIAMSKQMKGDDAQLKPLSVKPETLFVSDITPDPRHWTNGCWEDYFSVTNIRVVQ